jgi:hypothetical protein
MKKATYLIPHDGTAAGTAAKLVLHVAKRMGRRNVSSRGSREGGGADAPASSRGSRVGGGAPFSHKMGKS